MTTLNEELKQRIYAIKLYGLLAHWDELTQKDAHWVNNLAQWEEAERKKRSLDRRLNSAHLGRFKSLADFDWDWLESGDSNKDSVSELMTLEFIKEASNVILVGTNGLGKSTIAKNIAHHAVLNGYTALFISAADMLGDLAAQDGANALRRRIKYYAQPRLLIIDELGYLAYGTRHADLLFEIINQRYEDKSIVVTTNKPFSEWGEVFPNAACVVSIVDRLIHHSDIVVLEGDSYRMKEAKDQASKKREVKKTKPARKSKSTEKDKV